MFTLKGSSRLFTNTKFSLCKHLVFLQKKKKPNSAIFTFCFTKQYFSYCFKNLPDNFYMCEDRDNTYAKYLTEDINLDILVSLQMPHTFFTDLTTVDESSYTPIYYSNSEDSTDQTLIDLSTNDDSVAVVEHELQDVQQQIVKSSKSRINSRRYVGKPRRLGHKDTFAHPRKLRRIMRKHLAYRARAVVPKLRHSPESNAVFFFKKYFGHFKIFFFKNYVLSKVFFKKKQFSARFVSSLLFLPDFLFSLNYQALQISKLINTFRYNNIVPIFNIPLQVYFKKKRAVDLIDTNVFLWYLLNFFEKKLCKPLFLKVVYFRNIFKKVNFFRLFLKLFRKFRRYMFKFKHNFYLAEIIRVLFISVLSRDPTFFLNWFIWTLMQLPYKNVKGFLYFLKILLKKHVLPACFKLKRISGFIFDIRGKVGVTGDAKKRHTIIQWGQSSFSRKNLKLSLKQGLVYTRTGVMGVTVIMTF